MKIPSLELVDGMYMGEGKDTDAYIEVTIPYEWLTDDAFDDQGDCKDCENAFIIPLNELISERLRFQREVWYPSKQSAMRTIKALRKYIAHLEECCINAEDAYEEGAMV